jgi:hypothetical protein
MNFPSPNGRSKYFDLRKVARLWLEKLQDGQRLASVHDISKALGCDFPEVFRLGDLSQSQRADERIWSGYCVALWEAAPVFVEAALADPIPEAPKPAGKPIWERLLDED